MSVHIRMIRSFYTSMLADLSRPHPFAMERVGFLFARRGTAANDLHLIFPVDYVPVPDEQYVPVTDSGIGAEIKSAAIRAAMQRTMDTGEGVFHVHMHEHQGCPRFSRIDRRELPLLVRSFQHANPSSPHGAFLLSKDYCIALAWLPGKTDPLIVERVSIIGYPVAFFGSQQYAR